jgi:hypothetical protein
LLQGLCIQVKLGYEDDSGEIYYKDANELTSVEKFEDDEVKIDDVKKINTYTEEIGE